MLPSSACFASYCITSGYLRLSCSGISGNHFWTSTSFSRFASYSAISGCLQLHVRTFWDLPILFAMRFPRLLLDSFPVPPFPHVSVFHIRKFRMFLSSSRFASCSIISGCFHLPDILGFSRLVLDSFPVPSFSDVPSFMFELSWSSPIRFAFYHVRIFPSSSRSGRPQGV